MEVVNNSYDFRNLAGNRPATLVLQPHTNGEITFDGSNRRVAVFTAPVDQLWRPCSDAAVDLGYNQENGYSRLPYEFFQQVKMSTVVAYAASRPFEFNPNGDDEVSQQIIAIDRMPTMQWHTYATADGEGNVEYRLGNGRRVLNLSGSWVDVHDGNISGFFRDIAATVKPGGQIELEDFIGSGGFRDEPAVYRVLDEAGLVLTGFRKITSIHDTDSAVIRKSLRSGVYGIPGKFSISKPADDNGGDNRDRFSPSPEPMPDKQLQPEYA